MVRLNLTTKNEIIERFQKGATTGEIMTEYKLSRSTAQRIKNDLNDNVSNASSSKSEMNELLNDLNNVHMTDEMTDQVKMTDEMTDDIQPIYKNDTFHNLRGKMNIIDKLDLFNENKKPIQQHQPVQNHQPIQQHQPKI